jgi:NAD-dependent dihydropyrimidine dehydrogenase PreA subunit
VLVTANFDLTVRRLMRALHGVDAWIVVAPSKGINVWCAASGGHLTTHQVVTALKTSGVEEHVNHRHAILPQLAATGVRGVEVSRRCGWKVKFGPVYAQDVPAYLEGSMKKTETMRRVRFGLVERLEMATAWAAPISIIIVALALLLRPAWSLPLVALTWGLAIAAFLLFDRIRPAPRLVLGASAVALALGAVLLGGGGTAALVAAPLCAVILTAIITADLQGSSPTETARTLDGHDWRIDLDPDRCNGVYLCWDVCPEACFEKREEIGKVEHAHEERCIRCGACVVQCPMDALSFVDETGRRIDADVVRRFKLNLLGRRTVDAGAQASPGTE